MKTNIILFVLLISHVACVASDDGALIHKNASWQRRLEERKFEFQDSGGLVNSLLSFSGDCKLHLICDASEKSSARVAPHITIELVREAKTLVSLRGSVHATFLTSGDAFVFARFGATTPGCTVEAYSMSTGAQIWASAELRDFGPFGYTAGYLNEVSIRPSRKGEISNEDEGNAIVVAGRESYGDYVTVLDSKTGEILASKVYRVGFEYPRRKAEVEKK